MKKAKGGKVGGRNWFLHSLSPGSVDLVFSKVGEPHNRWACGTGNTQGEAKNSIRKVQMLNRNGLRRQEHPHQ